MNVLRNIFGRIWAVWGLLTFFVTMLIFFIPFLMFGYWRPDPIPTQRFISFSRIWMKVYLNLIGCPLTVKGRKNFKKGENYIVLCNHYAFMDIPISSTAIPGGNKTIAKAELAKVPLFGILYKVGSVLVDRKSERSRKESFGKMKAVLQMGLHMCIYPEGTRNLTDQPLKSFHDGAFKLAVETGKAIIPGVIFYTRNVMPAKPVFSLFPHRLLIHFLEPIPVSRGDNYDELKNKVFNLMTEHYLNHLDKKTK